MKKTVALILAALLLPLCACGRQAAGSDLAGVQEKGRLIVGVTDFAPMDYKDENGQWAGFDADMARAFAEFIGVEAEFVEIDWDNKILELDAGTLDCVWNGMTLNGEVLDAMSCSAPYCDNSQVVVMRAELLDQYPDAASMAGLSFAVEAGSAGEDAAGAAGFDALAVPSQADALMGVAAGTSDACVIDLLMAKAMTGEGTSYPGLGYALTLTDEQYGVGFRKGSDLAGAFAEFYAAAWDAGTVRQIAAQYGIEGSVVAAG